ncbi:hypothetical protein ABZR18_31820, partial [Pseudomonas aeruginosa]
GKQCALPSVLSLDKALHWRPPLILNPSNHSKDDANVFTRSGPLPDAGQAVDLERIRNRLNQLNLELLRGYAPALAELRVDDCRPRLNQALQRQVRDDRLDELHAIALSRAAGDLCHWAAL